MRIGEVWKLTREALSAWSEDYAPSMGAAIAFYTIFSVAPVLIVIIAVAGFFFGEEAARGELFGQIRGMLGDEAAAAVQGIVREASRPGSGIVALTVGAAMIVVGATTMFAELTSAINRIWRAPAAEPGGMRAAVVARVKSLALVLGIALLLLVWLAASAILSAIGNWWSAYLGGWEMALQVINFAVGFAILTTLFAFMYRFLPRTGVAWGDVWLGAAVTAVLFIIGRYLIGLYLTTAGVGSGFGAAGSLVVLLMWVYYSAQIFLFGAEFTRAYAHRHGSHAASVSVDRPASGSETAPAFAGLRFVALFAIVGFILGMTAKR